MGKSRNEKVIVSHRYEKIRALVDHNSSREV